MAAQLRGGGIVVNIYYVLHYASSPAWSVSRQTDIAWTAGIFPAMVIGYYIPHFIETFAESAIDRQKWNYLWQPFPIWVSSLQILLYLFTTKSKGSRPRVQQATTRSEMTVIRYTIGTFIVLSSITWLYTIICSPLTLAEIFVPSWDPPTVSGPEGIVASMLTFIQFDFLFCWTSTAVWFVLLFKDLKDVGMVEMRWTRLYALGVGMMVVLGPLSVGLLVNQRGASGIGAVCEQ